jgi:hypothetical protein
MSDIVEMLRLRACSVEEYSDHDHGHSDCYLEREAADEIERLRNLIIAWVDADDRDIPFSSKYYDCTCQKEFCLASRALRRGVGR